MYKLLIYLASFIYTINSQKLNVCNNFLDYLTMDPKNCWHNPEMFMNIPEIIKRHNYPVEAHETLTEDGYYLTMLRMPKEGRKGIVYLQHPMFSNCAMWIDKGVNDSLGFLLWDAGFEVWLGNTRGAYYSKKHKHFDISSREYWNYSFHEIALYDIPAQVNLITTISNARNQEISYVGLSMSATSGVVYASMLPEQSAKSMNVLILMAPTMFVENEPTFIGALCSSIFKVEKIITNLQIEPVLSNGLLARAVASLCRMPYMMYLCMIVELTIAGNVPEEQEAKWFPVKLSQDIDGTAVKALFHFGQIYKSKRFQMYDYGLEGNLKTYKSELPPIYPYENIRVPLYLVYGYNDNIVLKENVDNFYEELPEKAKIYGKFLVKEAGHATFIYGTHTRNNIYLPFIKLLNKISKEKNFS